MPAPLHEPVPEFLTIIAVMLLSPLLFRRVRMPGIVGLVLGGMIVGPHGLGLLAETSEIELLATIGLLYLMFSAGLEIDLHQFARVRSKSILFGLLTFSLPLASGIPLGRIFGLSWSGALLLGSVYASHTLLAFPVISDLGVVRNEAVAVTVGATVFTDVASLLVLAVVASTSSGSASSLHILGLVLAIAAYAVIVVTLLPRVGKVFFRRYSGRTLEFQFVLVSLFVAALLAEQIGLHAIVGAFLAGLAINATLPPRSPVIGQVLFIGESLFVPMFLMYVGMITDPRAIVSDANTVVIGVVLTAAVYVTKYLAARIAARLLGYGRDEMLTMWGLSQAQAAATLATILVGAELGLFPLSVFNGVVLTILCTSITSPLITQAYGQKLEPAERVEEAGSLFDRIMIAVANPQTEEHLIRLAGLLCSSCEGTLLPINVAVEVEGRVRGADHQQSLLGAQVIDEFGSRVRRIARVDGTIASGILHAAVENDASMIVMGWRGEASFPQTVLGTVLDEVVWGASVPVLVGRMRTPINALRRVVLVVPPRSLARGLARRTCEMALSLARATNVSLLVLSTPRYLDRLKAELETLDDGALWEIDVLDGDIPKRVIERADAQHLVIVTTTGSRLRLRSSLGEIPERMAAQLPCSMVVIHYP